MILLSQELFISFFRVVLKLGEKFSMKDLGPLHFFLGIEVNYFEGGIHLNQSKYGAEMLAKTEMTLANVTTLLVRNMFCMKLWEVLYMHHFKE